MRGQAIHQTVKQNSDERRSSRQTTNKHVERYPCVYAHSRETPRDNPPARGDHEWIRDLLSACLTLELVVVLSIVASVIVVQEQQAAPSEPLMRAHGFEVGQALEKSQ